MPAPGKQDNKSVRRVGDQLFPWRNSYGKVYAIVADCRSSSHQESAALLATRRIKSDRVFATIDWGLLVFFSGLFVVTGSLEVQGLTNQLFVLLQPIAQAGLVPFGLVTAVLSN